MTCVPLTRLASSSLNCVYVLIFLKKITIPFKNSDKTEDCKNKGLTLCSPL